MPWVTINVMEGHSQEQKDILFKKVTKSISESLDLPSKYVKIQLIEMDWGNHSFDGKTRQK